MRSPPTALHFLFLRNFYVFIFRDVTRNIGTPSKSLSPKSILLAGLAVDPACVKLGHMHPELHIIAYH